MSINTNLANRVKHTNLPKSAGLMPLFEAVVNSIHSIEEAGLPTASGRIIVEIIRGTQGSLEISHDGPGREPLNDIEGFKIIDNGVGFNDTNLASFKTLDSDHKAAKGCRGVGRLLWLKAFERVTVSSDYVCEDNTLSRCTFDFSAQSGVANHSNTTSPQEATRETRLHLDGFREKYRDSSRKTADAIARQLFEHCLWYFIRPGGSPSISIKDGHDVINLDAVSESSLHTGAVSESISVKDVNFELTHIKLRTSSSQSHQIAFCAANRLVKEEPLKGKIPGLYGKISDPDGDFIYSCYISSPLLDESVRNERTGFDIEDEASGLFAGSTVSINDIRDAVISKAKLQLDGHLQEGIRLGQERVVSFIDNQAPRYRPILSRIPEDQLIVDPTISNKDLELTLHKHYAEIERQLLADGHDMVRKIDVGNAGDYKEELDQYLAGLSELKKSDLANYVSHRKVVIDLLEKAIQVKDNGKYAKEDLIHSLIIPMGVDSSQLLFDDMNLWLIDERLAFHNFLASDRPLSTLPITSSDSGKEPDIISLSINDNPVVVSEEKTAPFSSLTIIEMKRPMRNDIAPGEVKDPLEQVFGYLRRIRAGEVTTANGRALGQAAHLPAYCYVIADLTKTLAERCRFHQLEEMPDGLGFFGYHKNYKAYVEVISFDRLVHSSKQRHRAFFDKLGLPT